MAGYKNELLTLKVDYTLINSVNPDEMPHDVASHLGFHCLQNYQVYKWYKIHAYLSSVAKGLMFGLSIHIQPFVVCASNEGFS